MKDYLWANAPYALVAGHRQPFGRSVVPSQGLNGLTLLEGEVHPSRRAAIGLQTFGARREG